MSVATADRLKVTRILATRRCRELDHVPPVPPAPCNRCLAWTQRRVEELEEAGVIRTTIDHANAAAVAHSRALLRAWRWPSARRLRRDLAAALGDQ